MKHRLFIAISLPETTISQIVAVQSGLEKLILPINWTLPENLHLTLNFLGRLTDTQETTLRHFLTKFARLYEPIDLHFPYLEYFFNKHEPSNIYVSVSSPDIVSLQKNLTQSLRQLDIPQPFRYIPHVTIGQVKKTDPTLTKQVLDRISQVNFTPLTSITATALTLYESYLSAKGAKHVRVGNFRLGPKPEVPVSDNTPSSED